MPKLSKPRKPTKLHLRKIADELRQIRKGAKLKGISIRELINTGRRY